MIKIISGAIVGIVLCAAFCWGSLYLYGAFVLHGEGSLFDTNPSVANAFFITWGALTIVCAIAGGMVAARKNSSAN